MFSCMISCLSPPDSSILIFFDRFDNVWMDEDGETYLDLQEFGFTPLQRQTILINIFKDLQAEYLYLVNDFGETLEIFWEDGEIELEHQVG